MKCSDSFCGCNISGQVFSVLEMKSVFGCLGFLVLLCSQSLVCAQCSTCLEEKCYDTGECILGCVAGYFDKYCNETCPLNCLKEACHTNKTTGVITCSNGCVPGYCRSKCLSVCAPGCLTCDRQCNTCNVTQCPEGRYGADCSQTCDPNYEKCDKETGKCIRCRRGYYGDNCDKQCTTCFTIAQDVVFSCQSGCDRCRSQASCPGGSYGDKCDRTCSRNCGSSNSDQDKPCNKATGECSAGCQSGFYGRTCNYTCSEHCDSQRCKQTTGECSAGCQSGYYGRTCNYTCSELCMLRICNQQNGSCEYGCISGYKTIHGLCERINDEDKPSIVSVVLPLVACAGAVVVIGVMIHRRRRRRWGKTTALEFQEPLIPFEVEAGEREEILNIWNNTKDEIDAKTKYMIRVSAVDTVIKKMKAGQNWITITGNAGDGKTILAYLVLKELSKQMSVYNIYLPEEYKLLLRIKGDRVILFDDRFGAFTADAVLIKNWLSVIQDMLNSQQTRIIFVSRINVVKEAQNYLGRFKEIIFNPDCVVDLSTMKIIDERKSILDYYLKVENLKVDASVKKRVAELDIAHGFPHCCMMYSKLKKRINTIDIEEFFISPLKFLDMTTAVLYEENCKELFDLMIKNEGEFNAYSIKDDAQRRKLLKIEKEQEGSYITVWKNGVCTFAHPSIYESVLSVICDTDPLFCVKYASLSVIRQKVNLTSEHKNKIPTRINVNPVPAVLEALAERFRPEILDGDYTVFGHRFCENKDFCDKLLDCCVSSETGVSNKESTKLYINKAGKDGQTMLWMTLKGGINSAVRSLVQHGADVNIPDESGMTPLFYLCGRETLDVDTIKLMITTGKADCNVSDERGMTPLLYLCGRETLDVDTIKLMITTGKADCNVSDESGMTPLLYLCGRETLNVDTIKWMVTTGKADCNVSDERGMTPLLYLCGNKTIDVDTIKWMITTGKADCNVSDERGLTPLLYLCGRDPLDVETIKWMVTTGKADCNVSDERGMTPLHQLCVRKAIDIETIKLVVSEGQGDINKGDEYRSTPLHYLCKHERVDLGSIHMISVNGKGDINKMDDFRITPLHYLCRRNNEFKKIVSLVAKMKGDINQADQYGNTPLHYLCRRDEIVDVSQLKQIPGADMDKQNELGHSALDYLQEREKTKKGRLPPTKTMKEKLPWTEGIVDRSVADLVMCKLRRGEKWIPVLGPAMTLSAERVHEYLKVEDGDRELNNMAWSGERPGQFSSFIGTCSNPIPLPSSPSTLTTPRYWETNSQLLWKKEAGCILEMGVSDERNLDAERFVSSLPRSWSVSVRDYCRHHGPSLCIQVNSGKRQVGGCISLSPPTPGTQLNFTFGLVLDVGRGRLGLIDVKRGKLLHKFDGKFQEEVVPMFFVHPNNDFCDVRMRLVSGREISVTDSKIKLIQEALFD